MTGKRHSNRCTADFHKILPACLTGIWDDGRWGYLEEPAGVIESCKHSSYSRNNFYLTLDFTTDRASITAANGESRKGGARGF
jgi:hypothetical protein